jgi:hypothetical protein
MADRGLRLLAQLERVKDDDLVAVENSGAVQDLLAAILATATWSDLPVASRSRGRAHRPPRALALGHRLAAATASAATAAAVFVAAAQGAH